MADLIERDGLLIAPLNDKLELVEEAKATLFRVFYPDGHVELRTPTKPPDAPAS